MVIKIKRVYLEALLDKASSVSTANVNIDACKSFLLEVEKIGEVSYMLHILRTDTELSTVVHTQMFQVSNLDEPVRVLIPSDHLYELVRKLDTEEIEFETLDKGGVKIRSGSFFGEWFTYHLDEFPSLPSLNREDSACYEISAKDFIKDIERVRDLLPEVGIHPDENWIRFDQGMCWVFDGHRHQRILSSNPKMEMSVPKKALGVLRFIKASGIENITIGEDESFWYCFVGDDLFICQIGYIKPPPVDFINRLDRGNQGHFDFETNHLRCAIERIGITSGVEKKVVFDVKERSLVLSSGTGEQKEREESRETIPIQFNGNSKAKKVFSVNWEYFTQSLKVLGEASARMYIDIGVNYIVLESKDSRAVIPMLKK